MEINLSQQVSATYARNHFKEVNNKAIKEGMCIIVRKSEPVTVIMSFKEYEKIKNPPKKTSPKKITLEELRKNSIFENIPSNFDKVFGNISSVELAKKWTDYVD